MKGITMLKVQMLAAGMLVCSVATAVEEVKVSSFGYDPDDSTKFIQAALDSGARKVVIDRMEKPWITQPVKVKSNTQVVFEEGVELVAKRGEYKGVYDSLISVVCVSNVTLRGIGKGATLRMWAADYMKPPYKGGEWRHALNILSSTDVTVENLSFVKSGGDGIYLGEKRGTNRKITIRNCVCDGNTRQGISVITADSLLIEKTTLKNTRGKLPQAGIDFEPNSMGQLLRNCVMRDCLIEGNAGNGIEFFLIKLRDTSVPISVKISNCRIIGNELSGLKLAQSAAEAKGGPWFKGKIELTDSIISDSRGSGIVVFSKPYEGIDFTVSNCDIINSPRGKSTGADINFLSMSFWIPAVDNVNFKDVRIFQPVERAWISASARPWLRNVTDVKGNVEVTTGGVTKKITLDDEWRAKTFPATGKKPDLSVTEFSADSNWKVVDTSPGTSVRLSPIKFRGRFSAIVYADAPSEISFSACLSHVVNRGAKSTGEIVVKDMAGKTIATLDGFETTETARSFTAPRKGFYEITVKNIKRESLIWCSCNAPLAIRAKVYGLSLFQPAGEIFIPHDLSVPRTMLCGGGGGERINADLFDPSGKMVESWKSLGDWGVRELDASGIWRLKLSRPTRGTYEDTHINSTGKTPALFFLSPEKYFFQQGL